MDRNVTQSELVMRDIMEFTQTVVGIAEMREVANPIRAQAIFLAEKVLHKMIMDSILEKCCDMAVPSEN